MIVFLYFLVPKVPPRPGGGASYIKGDASYIKALKGDFAKNRLSLGERVRGAEGPAREV